MPRTCLACASLERALSPGVGKGSSPGMLAGVTVLMLRR
jgi:hypothetical protein